jgi:alkanesulfonate monooxygenase SsuD/methylene tetrahydromethanopterin reductase-like flavin-dependent oxidoreductase (luciferase family)
MAGVGHFDPFGVVKTYEALNIAYSESKDREIECLEIIRRAWREDNFSYKGKFYDKNRMPGDAARYRRL